MPKKSLLPRAVVLMSFAVGAGGAVPLSAQNLLANPEFPAAAGLSGWQAFDGFFPPSTVCTSALTCASFSVVPVDCCAGAPENGVSASAPVSTAERYLHQCLPVTAGTAYELGAWTRRTDDNLHQNGRPYLGVHWFSSADCSGAEVGSPEVITSDAVPWHRLEDVATAPAGAISAEFRMGMSTSGLAGNPAIIDFAAPSFGVEGTVSPPERIPTLGGWGLVALSALLGLGGWRTIGRRAR